MINDNAASTGDNGTTTRSDKRRHEKNEEIEKKNTIQSLLTNPKMEKCCMCSSASSSFHSGPDSMATTEVRWGCRPATSELFGISQKLDSMKESGDLQ